MTDYLTRMVSLHKQNALYYSERFLIPLIMVSRAAYFFFNNDYHSYDSVSFFGHILKPIFFAFFLVISSSKNKKLDLRAALGLVMSFSILHFLEISHEKLSPNLIAVISFCYLFYIVMFVIALRNLGRSFTIIPTFTAIKSNGFYSLIRHPLYSSYLHFAAVFLLINPTYKNFGLFIILIIGLMLRSISEEKFLSSQDSSYDQLMKDKPRFLNWYISSPVIILVAFLLYLKLF